MAKENKTPVAPPPAEGPKTERIQEMLPPKLVDGLRSSGRTPEQVLATKSYVEQKMWAVVTSDGQKLEISFDGKWLNEPKPKAEKAVNK